MIVPRVSIQVSTCTYGCRSYQIRGNKSGILLLVPCVPLYSSGTTVSPKEGPLKSMRSERTVPVFIANERQDDNVQNDAKGRYKAT